MIDMILKPATLVFDKVPCMHEAYTRTLHPEHQVKHFRDANWLAGLYPHPTFERFDPDSLGEEFDRILA
ncbi:hypothetical protein C5167_013245 [Papaver somniferum]|uniref:Uncharacterized protein n=1 Tax=Papaver somniferum TaxID=3469 RepID=A0A4Y7IZR4_PAPSO|nr:hypothetical protein C5167_013245 [Papaver somniferum]